MAIKNVVGILGAGRIGRVHAESITNNFPYVSIKYIADPYLSPEAEAWAKDLGIAHAVKDADVIFNDPEVDCVVIGSPTPTHCDFILKACASGKNIYCEKPMDSDIGRIYKAIDAIEKSGVKFMIGFMRRFDASQKKMRDSIAEGKLGRPEILKLCSRDPGLPPYEYIAVSGGAYFDQMIHDIDLARYFAMSEVEEVYAVGAALVDPKVAEYGDVDTAIAVLKFENGALCTIDTSRRSNCGYDQRTEVHGSLGCMQVNNVPETNTVFRCPEGVIEDKPVYFFLERYHQAFVSAQKAFFDMVNNDLPSPVTGNDGLQAVRVAKAAQKSKDEGRPVKMSEIE
jgi:myo-inositol 2-dehydrogenase/D-chiro-inositol 1-dehydrogenase